MSTLLCYEKNKFSGCLVHKHHTVVYFMCFAFCTGFCLLIFFGVCNGIVNFCSTYEFQFSLGCLRLPSIIINVFHDIKGRFKSAILRH